MTVRRVLFSESSANLGGQELQLLSQAKGLQNLGIETGIVCKPGSRIAGLAMTAGIHTRFVPFRNSLHLPSIRAVRDEIKRFRPDAIIAHSGHDANVCAVAARLVRRRPVLLRARTYQPGIPGAMSYNRLFDRTLVPSEELRRNLLANPAIDPQRIHVLYPGLDFASIAARAALDLSPHLQTRIDRLPPRRLVHAAMLRGEKGHLLMLEVIAMLQHRYPDLAYVAAGEGPMRDTILARAAELAIIDRMLLLGMVDNVPALLAQAELVVMPSSYEPLGMSQIEALSLGIPVIGSHIGGIPETIQDEKTGLLAPAGNPAAWANRVAHALDNAEAMSAMAEVGRLDVLCRFSLESNLEQLLGHIEAARGEIGR